MVLRAFGFLSFQITLFCTPGGTWTHTPLRARDFKSLVSTNSTTQALTQKIPTSIGTLWSGKRDSNSRPRPWQGRALPTELFPLCELRGKSTTFFNTASNFEKKFPFFFLQHEFSRIYHKFDINCFSEKIVFNLWICMLKINNLHFINIPFS